MKLNLTSDLRYFSRELVRELGFLNDPYQKMGLNFAKVHVLLECEQNEFINQQELAIKLRLNKSYISRLVKDLVIKDLLIQSENSQDQRLRHLSLSIAGKKLVQKINQEAEAQVLSALAFLDSKEVTLITEGLNLYAKALKKGRRLKQVTFRSLQKKDNTKLNQLIKEVLAEYGANKSGFAFMDEELNDMFAAYQGSNKAYLVAERDGVLLGGVGLAPLDGADGSIAELKKMYLSKDARGLGLGDELLRLILAQSKTMNFKNIYLETLSSMTQAVSLYRRHGFEFLKGPKGNTGHFGCDTWMMT